MDIKIIEKLETHHIEKLHKLYQNEWFTKGRTLEDVNQILLHTDFVFGFCLAGQNELIGFARVISDRVYKAFVFDVIVDPDYRGQGLGKTIMHTLFNHPILSRVSHIELYCPKKLVPFYKKLGFKQRTSLLLRKVNQP